ncbi:9882_t:CDS:2 [Paraglomus brasilianum]|uniref:9882_t:CDS:1 n=1 Tax=Paraglomus brasilianum TaxID=144538 RepID=A0A9N8ZNP8_9GLOM|nr:9882_t:CDS:2 [Paraglomus brasilianum]
METDSGTSSTFLPSTVCSSTSTLTTQTPAVTTTPTNADFEEPLQARFLVLERKLWELEVNAERDVGSSIDVGELDNMQDMQRGASEVRSVEDTEVDREDESVIETVIDEKLHYHQILRKLGFDGINCLDDICTGLDRVI